MWAPEYDLIKQEIADNKFNFQWQLVMKMGNTKNMINLLILLIKLKWRRCSENIKSQKLKYLIKHDEFISRLKEILKPKKYSRKRRAQSISMEFLLEELKQHEIA